MYQQYILTETVYLPRAQVSRQSCPLLSKLMTSQAVQGTWIHMDSYGQFRGRWVRKIRLPGPSSSKDG